MNIASANEESAKKAIAIIQELTATAELNKTYMGKVQPETHDERPPSLDVARDDPELVAVRLRSRRP